MELHEICQFIAIFLLCVAALRTDDEIKDIKEHLDRKDK
jgi:hypothetical protein